MNKILGEIEYFLSHMAPVIYYVQNKVYSNFDYLNNLLGNGATKNYYFLIGKTINL
ncbi:hypothetical protein SIN01_20590 [Sporolactobacillus inulinus]|nr:hypothetical protein SIN01_20590 [Sporolactobacillus inulinus]